MNLKVGVLLGPGAADPGDYLADARALETAGVDSLWMPIDQLPDGRDPWLLLAAVGVVTARVQLVALTSTKLNPANGSAPFTTLQWLARSRTTVAVGDDAGAMVGAERWLRVPSPEGPAGWRETQARAAAAGVTGIVVPMNSRLLDLLRRPDAEDDRSDLLLSQG